MEAISEEEFNATLNALFDTEPRDSLKRLMDNQTIRDIAFEIFKKDVRWQLEWERTHPHLIEPRA